MRAILKGRLDIVNLLVGKMNVNLQTSDGYHALHFAIFMNNFNLAKFLLKVKDVTFLFFFFIRLKCFFKTVRNKR